MLLIRNLLRRRLGQTEDQPMVRQQSEGWLELEQIGEVTIARFTARHLLDEEKMQTLGGQLRSLGEQAGHRPLVLNFGQVERLSTELMGTLVALQRRVQEKGGRLALCQIHPPVYELFHIFTPPQLLSVFP